MIAAGLGESLVTALVAAGSSLAAVVISYWLPERRRRLDQAGRRREQAAQITEPLRNLLIEARRVSNREDANAIRQRWIALRDPVTIFGMAQNSAGVTALVLRLREVVGEYIETLESPESPNPKREHLAGLAVEMVRDLRAACGMVIATTDYTLPRPPDLLAKYGRSDEPQELTLPRPPDLLAKYGRSDEPQEPRA